MTNRQVLVAVRGAELFIAPDSDLDKSKIEQIKSILSIKSATTSEREAIKNLIGPRK